MKDKLLPKILGGLIGFILGLFGGGYLGLVVGGTFLGGFDIYEATGFEGYELASYAGAIIGALVLMRVGIKFAQNRTNKEETNM